MVKKMKTRSVNLFQRVYLSIIHSSFINDILFNLLTVSPINLNAISYGYRSAFIFIYLISLISSYLSYIFRPSFHLFNFEVLIDRNFPFKSLEYVLYPFLFSFPYFLLNAFLVFIVQVVGINLIKTKKNSILYGLFSSITIFIPFLIPMVGYFYFCNLIIHAISVLAVYFVQNTLELTYSYVDSRSSIIRYVVLYVAFQMFFYLSLFFSSFAVLLFAIDFNPFYHK